MSNIKNKIALLASISLLSLGLTSCQSEANMDQSSANKDKDYDCSASETIAAAKAGDKAWNMQKTSKSGDIAIDFACTRSPFVGDFQSCHIQLTQKGKGKFADEIAIDGGMQAHGHGLPTVPKLSPSAKAGFYDLEGLKYSMPGAWIVGFKVNIDGVTEQIVFDFTI